MPIKFEQSSALKKRQRGCLHVHSLTPSILNSVHIPGHGSWTPAGYSSNLMPSLGNSICHRSGPRNGKKPKKKKKKRKRKDVNEFDKL